MNTIFRVFSLIHVSLFLCFQHTFCKECVKKSANEICPIDKKPSKYIVDNIALSEQIGELQIHCKYGCKKTESGDFVVDKGGCPTVIKISERFHHESGCMFAPTSCPNNPNCPQFPKKVSSSLHRSNLFFLVSYLTNGLLICHLYSGFTEAPGDM